MSGPPRCLAKPRGASQCAGVSPLRVLDDSFINASLVLLLEGLRPFLRRLRGGRRTFDPPPCWTIFRTFLQFFTFFSHFGRILSHHCIFYRFFLIFHRFWEDFGWIWGTCWQDFSKIFRIFLKIADLQNSCAHAVFRKGPALKN